MLHDPVNTLLKAYETYRPPTTRRGEALFTVWLLTTAALFIGAGCYLHTIKALPQSFEKRIGGIKAQFVFDEGKKTAPPLPVEKKKPREIPAPREPIDLTEKPTPAAPEINVNDEPPPAATAPAPRAVFGLRRVYSVGLGSGGSTTDAIVAKIGNTIGKGYDTVTATQSDIKGAVVSTATVTTAPRFRKVIKPVYTKEMIDRRIEGTVKVKVLVDIDGRVKKATCLNDIGCDSAAQAVKATLSMEFDPAVRGSEPVAVWIIVPIRFMLLG